MKGARVRRARFRAIAEEELAAIPRALRELLVNVTIEVQDEPASEAVGLDDAEDLLGLYSGPDRAGILGGGGELPARVYLYQRNIEDSAESPRGLRREIRLTLRHELAHHFGFDDEALERVWPEGASSP